MSDKRPHESESSSEDDDFGPGPGPAPLAGQGAPKKRKLKHTSHYLSKLPNYDRYTRSHSHQATITTLEGVGEWILSGSSDGVVKFWRKSKEAGEFDFIKHYQAHDDKIVGATFSQDGAYAATISSDKSIKIFDVVNSDMINIVRLDYEPRSVCWCQGKLDVNWLAVSECSSGTVRVYNPTDNQAEVIEHSKIHKSPVNAIAYNPKFECVVSCDELGMVEYWQPDTGLKPSSVFEMKSHTNLYDFRKRKTRVVSLVFNPSYTKFATVSADGMVTIFHFAKGKKLKELNESIETNQEMQQFGTGAWHPESSDFTRRLGLEKDLVAHQAPQRCVFDASGNFLLYPTMLGIKCVNLKTNACHYVLGKEEKVRMVHLVLYQGQPKHRNLNVESAASSNKIIAESMKEDPVLVASGFKKNRFYLFTRFEGDFSSIRGDRDLMDLAAGMQASSKADPSSITSRTDMSKFSLPTKAVLHTSMGDIHVKLYPNFAPKAVENFTTHCRNGYYNGVIFHRVIKNFMIQTGDPEGDGTGGDSIWGGSFDDEFTPKMRHDVGSLSMANAGKNTNRSQFFITTIKTPWLDDKHTIFGKVVQGMDVVHQIEYSEVDKSDRPLRSITIVSCSTT